MRNTFNLAFYCRSSHMDKKGFAPIELSLSMNSRRCLITLPMKMQPGTFEKQMAAKKNNELKAYVSSVEEHIRDLQMKYATAGKVLTLEDIQTFVKSGFNNSYTLNELWEEFFQSFKSKGTTARNERKYELVKESFFAHVIDGSEQVADLNHAHILAYERYLKSTFSNSTAANMLSKLRTIVLFGINTDKIEADPFKGIKIVKKAKEVDFLTMDEVNRLRDKTMPNERLERVKDLFLFQCFTALSYCDMAALSPVDYQNNQYGQIYIEKHRAKTRIQFCTILFEDAVDIAKKYDYKLPVISNQRYNGYLKEVADICGIDKTLHSHLGRHTAGCYLLNKGLPIEVVAKIMGHTNTRMTRHYAHLLRDTVFSSVAALSANEKSGSSQ